MEPTTAAKDESRQHLTYPRDFGPGITWKIGSRFGGSNAQSAFHGRADGRDRPRGGSQASVGGGQAARGQQADDLHMAQALRWLSGERGQA